MRETITQLPNVIFSSESKATKTSTETIFYSDEGHLTLFTPFGNNLTELTFTSAQELDEDSDRDTVDLSIVNGDSRRPKTIPYQSYMLFRTPEDSEHFIWVGVMNNGSILMAQDLPQDIRYNTYEKTETNIIVPKATVPITREIALKLIERLKQARNIVKPEDIRFSHWNQVVKHTTALIELLQSVQAV